MKFSILFDRLFNNMALETRMLNLEQSYLASELVLDSNHL